MREVEWRVDGLEVVAKTRDGRSLDLVLYTQPLEIGGDACVLATLYDQTASKRIERQLVDQQWLFAEAERLSRAGSWQCVHGKVTWSAELYRLHGVAPESFEPSLDAWTALVHPADRKRFRDAIDNAMREMESFEVQHRIVLTDGAVRVLRSVGYCTRRGEDDAFRVVGYSSDITDLSETMEQLRATSRKLVDLQEESQRQLATAIHDRIGQLLTAISMNMERMRSRLAGDRNLESRLQDSIRLVHMATDAVVNILGDLRPAGLEELGLIPVLERFCTNFSKRTAIDTTLDVDIGGASIPSEWSTPIFRIVQEGLMNVAKHAGGARHATVRMSIERRQLQLSIEDDGVGLGLGQSSGAPSSGLGLVTTRERVAALGGSFSIGRGEGGGTRLLIRLPLEGAGDASRGTPVSGIY
jgi:signal transduction histidine kinase